jgi:hypothetical protein
MQWDENRFLDLSPLDWKMQFNKSAVTGLFWSMMTVNGLLHSTRGYPLTSNRELFQISLQEMKKNPANFDLTPFCGTN